MYALAVDIGGTKIAGAIVHCSDMLGVSCGQLSERKTLCRQCNESVSLGIPTVIEQKRIVTPAQQGGEAVFSAVCDMLSELTIIAENKRFTLTGCAVSSAGVIDPNNGSVVYASDLLPHWAGIHLRQRLQEFLGMPVQIINDVHAHGLGEAYFGAGRTYDSLLVVAVGTGLGGAFIEHGKLLMGGMGVAGSIAHLIHPLAVGMTCACGSRVGHIECIASGTGKKSLYNRYIAGGTPVTEGVDVTKRAELGERYAQEILAKSGGALGDTLASAAALLDPSAVIITGSAAQSGIWWWDSLRSHFADNALVVQRHIPILEGVLGSHAPLIGAVTLL